jgi:hypothetical protein
LFDKQYKFIDFEWKVWGKQKMEIKVYKKMKKQKIETSKRRKIWALIFFMESTSITQVLQEKLFSVDCVDFTTYRFDNNNTLCRDRKYIMSRHNNGRMGCGRVERCYSLL